MSKKINRNFSKNKAVLELVEKRKTLHKAKLTDKDILEVAKKYELSLESLKNCWKNFNLYGKPSLEFSAAGLRTASEATKESMREYGKTFNTSINETYNIEDISKILKEFIFGEFKTYKEFTNEYFVSRDIIYRCFKNLDTDGTIRLRRNTFQVKKVLTYDSSRGHGKLFPIADAVAYQRYLNKRKKYPHLKLNKYVTLDPMLRAQYENILAVLKEWL